MANIQTALFSELSTDANLASKLNYGTSKYHIYPFTIPDAQLKANSYFLTYQKISQRKITHLDIEIPLFQINCIATTYAKLYDLRDDVIRVLERFKGDMGISPNNRTVYYSWIEGERDMYDKDTELYFIPLEVRFKIIGNNQ